MKEEEGGRKREGREGVKRRNQQFARRGVKREKG